MEQLFVLQEDGTEEAGLEKAGLPRWLLSEADLHNPSFGFFKVGGPFRPSSDRSADEFMNLKLGR